MHNLHPYSVFAIPLYRTEPREMIQSQAIPAKGLLLRLVGQRPLTHAVTAWTKQLKINPTIETFLAIDDPHNHLIWKASDRIVPTMFLEDPAYLTRDLGGWTPIYFAVGAFPENWQQDPILKHAESLLDYGDSIQTFGANTHLVETRLDVETGLDTATLCETAVFLERQRQEIIGENGVHARMKYSEILYHEIAEDNRFSAKSKTAIPRDLLLDDMLAQFEQIELTKREAAANQEQAKVAEISIWQERFAEKTNLMFILKGEYIVGRHRGSMVLILPELGIVVKQPAPEPFHEIKLGAKIVNGRSENWPILTHNGALVTSRGRVRQIIEQNLIPALLRVFKHETQFSTLMGLTIEPFVSGQTIQEIALTDHGQMTPDLYHIFVLHQQVCELLGIENGDWHSANFIKRDKDGEIVHVDWGAARPLRPDEYTREGKLNRLNQVQNIAFSFHNEELARLVHQFHQALLLDSKRLTAIRQQAQALIGEANISR